jgi:hypothetical protein
MNRKLLLISLSIFLLTFLVLILLLYFRLQGTDISLTTSQTGLPSVTLESLDASQIKDIELIAPQPGDHITKAEVPGGGVLYDIEGSFVTPFEEHPSGIITADFVVKGDPLNRSFSAGIGSLDGNSFYGEIDSQAKASNWIVVRTDSIPQRIGIGEPVQIRIKIPIIGSDEQKIATREDISRVENIFDAMIYEFRNQDFKQQIPENLGLQAERVGLIK